MPLNLSRHTKWRTILASGLWPWRFVVGLIAFIVVCLYVPEISSEDYLSGMWH